MSGAAPALIGAVQSALTLVLAVALSGLLLRRGQYKGTIDIQAKALEAYEKAVAAKDATLMDKDAKIQELVDTLQDTNERLEAAIEEIHELKQLLGEETLDRLRARRPGHRTRPKPPAAPQPKP